MTVAERRNWLLGSLVQIASPGAALVDDRDCGCCPSKVVGLPGGGFLGGNHHHQMVVLPAGGWRCAHRGCRAGGSPGGGTAEFFGRLAALAGEGL